MWLVLLCARRTPLCLLALLLASQPSSLAVAAYKIQQIATGLDLPVHVTQAPGDLSSVYVVEQQTNDFLDMRSSGQIVKIDLATGAKTSFLRVQDIYKDPEGGLHTLAFHPDYDANGKFYISWVKNPTVGVAEPQLRLDEYQLQGGVPIHTQRLFDLTNLDASGDHGINWIGFKPGAVGDERNYLYFTTGDGGIPADDVNFTAESQDLSSVRGKVLRIDVAAADAYPADDARNYGFPASNPFAGDGDEQTLGEIYHYGFRNPWRASFDRETGDFYIGDVGFESKEEINFAKADRAGLDFGWSSREGTIKTPVTGVGAPRRGSEHPIFQLTHNFDQGIVNLGSITGGYVYRGPIEELQGQYIFAEAKARELLSGSFDRDTPPGTFQGDNFTDFTIRTTEFADAVEGDGTIDVVVSLGEDAYGHLYLVDYSVGLFANMLDEGEIYRLIPDLPADFTDDGFVDAADLAKWQMDVGINGDSDADGDGDSDGFDFLAWQKSMLSSTGNAGLYATVPEPTTLSLCVFVLAFGSVVPRTSGRWLH